MAVRRSDVYQRGAVGTRAGGIGPRLNQVVDGLEVVLNRREGQGRKARLGCGVNISALADQQLDDVRMFFPRGPHQRGLSPPGFRRFQASAFGDQQFHRVHEAGPRREHQRGFTAPARGVRVGAGFEQLLDPDLERRRLGMLAELSGSDLVGRNTRPDAQAFGFDRAGACEEGGASASMVAGSVAQRPRVGR